MKSHISDFWLLEMIVFSIWGAYSLFWQTLPLCVYLKEETKMKILSLFIYSNVNLDSNAFIFPWKTEGNTALHAATNSSS